jgi:hypothetical protein
MAFFMPQEENKDAGLQMSFEKQWHDGLLGVSRAFLLLSEPDLERLRDLTSLMVVQKGALQALVTRVGAASHCASCGGACCVAGKYHFTAVDFLVYLATGEPLFAPLFGNGLCPYLGEAGCLIPPAYRPFNCITFNCERIEDLLSGEEVSRFYQLERELRHNYGEIRSLFPGKTMDGALLKGAP